MDKLFKSESRKKPSEPMTGNNQELVIVVSITKGFKLSAKGYGKKDLDIVIAKLFSPRRGLFWLLIVLSITIILSVTTGAGNLSSYIQTAIEQIDLPP